MKKIKINIDVLDELISDFCPERDEFWYESSILNILEPYSSEEKDAMIKALKYVVSHIEEKKEGLI